MLVRRFNSISRLEWLALLLVLALAAALRFGWVGVNSFAFDEARLSLISLRMARGGVFATLGMPSSAGVPNLPAAAWLFAIPYVLSPDPLVATWAVGLVSLLCVAGVWALARREWGAWAGLTAALYMAASPYSVLYARSIWAQNLLPALALVWAWSAYAALKYRSSRAIALHMFIAGFAFQVHFAGAALIPGTLYMVIRGRWWRRLVPVLIGGGLALLALVPFALELLNNPDLLARFRAAFGSPAQFDVTALDALVRLALGTDWHYLAAGDLGLQISPLFMAGVALLFAGLARLAIRRLTLGAEVALVLLVVTPLFFLRHTTPVFIHYQLLALPALALVVGAGTTLLRRREWAAGVTALMLVVALGWTVQIGESLWTAGTVETPNGLGTPLGVMRDAAYGVDLPVLLFTHGDDPNTDGEAAVFSALWWGRPHRIVQGESTVILPYYPATLMATLAPFQAWEELEASGLARDVQQFERRGGALPFVSTFYDGESAPDGFTQVDPLPFNDGSQLEGWRVRRVGERLRVSTLWRVTELPPTATLQQFHHLRPADSPDTDPLMIADVPLSAYRWRVGDQVIVMGDFFEVEPGDYTVDIGHYTLPDVTRIPRAAGDGDTVRLGAFTVE